MIGRDHHLYVFDDGRVEVGGLEMGRSTVFSYHQAFTADRGHLVVYEAGSKYWSGLGQPQSYAPAEWHVFRVDELAEVALETRRGVVWSLRALHVATIPVTTNPAERTQAAEHLTHNVLRRVAETGRP